MKFEIKRELSKGIEVTSFKIIETDKPSIWIHWKALGVAALVGSVLTLILGLLLWLKFSDLGRFGIEVQTNRSTTVELRSNDEQERHRTGANGTTTHGY